MSPSACLDSKRIVIRRVNGAKDTIVGPGWLSLRHVIDSGTRASVVGGSRKILWDEEAC